MSWTKRKTIRKTMEEVKEVAVTAKRPLPRLRPATPLGAARLALERGLNDRQLAWSRGDIEAASAADRAIAEASRLVNELTSPPAPARDGAAPQYHSLAHQQRASWVQPGLDWFADRSWQEQAGSFIDALRARRDKLWGPRPD